MFKVGQKVICIKNSGDSMLGDFNFPPKNEILTIANILNKFGGLRAVISGYELDLKGRNQYFSFTHLRPLDETFADEVLERIKEEINEEQLVRI